MATTPQRERQQRPHGQHRSIAEPQAQPGDAQVTHLRTPTTRQNEMETSAPPVLTRKTMPSNEGKTRVGYTHTMCEAHGFRAPQRGIRDVLHATGVEKGTENVVTLMAIATGRRHRCGYGGEQGMTSRRLRAPLGSGIPFGAQRKGRRRRRSVTLTLTLTLMPSPLALSPCRLHLPSPLAVAGLP